MVLSGGSDRFFAGLIPSMPRAGRGGQDPRRAQGQRTVLILGDNLKRGEVETRLFGRPVRSARGPVSLALRSGAAVLPVYVIRNDAGGLELVVEEEMKLTRTGDLHADLQANTDRIMECLETLVRRYPDQWYWLTARIRPGASHCLRRRLLDTPAGDGRVPDKSDRPTLSLTQIPHTRSKPEDKGAIHARRIRGPLGAPSAERAGLGGPALPAARVARFPEVRRALSHRRRHRRHLAGERRLHHPARRGRRGHAVRQGDAHLHAGLNYHIPWPIEELRKVNVAEIRRLEVGFRSNPLRPNLVRLIPAESLMLTGDENIVSAQLTVAVSGQEPRAVPVQAPGPRDHAAGGHRGGAAQPGRQHHHRRGPHGGPDRVQTETQEFLQQLMDTYQSGIQITE